MFSLSIIVYYVFVYYDGADKNGNQLEESKNADDMILISNRNYRIGPAEDPDPGESQRPGMVYFAPGIQGKTAEKQGRQS